MNAKKELLKFISGPLPDEELFKIIGPTPSFMRTTISIKCGLAELHKYCTDCKEYKKITLKIGHTELEHQEFLDQLDLDISCVSGVIWYNNGAYGSTALWDENEWRDQWLKTPEIPEELK